MEHKHQIEFLQEVIDRARASQTNKTSKIDHQA